MSVYPLLNREKNEPQEMIQVRFNRLCALHAAGGGWISNYDVVNTGFNTQIAQAYEGNSFVIAESPASVMFVSKEICSAAMNKILNSELISENGIMLYEKDLFTPSHNLDVTTLHHSENYDEMKKIYEDYLTSK